MLTPGTNIHRLIVEDVIKSESVLSCWEAIAHCIPTKYEAYSVELLQVITDLWITNEVREQVQERNKKDIETETVAYINNATVACNLGLFVCIMLFLDVLEEAVILYVICSPGSTFIVFKSLLHQC